MSLMQKASRLCSFFGFSRIFIFFIFFFFVWTSGAFLEDVVCCGERRMCWRLFAQVDMIFACEVSVLSLGQKETKPRDGRQILEFLLQEASLPVLI